METHILRQFILFLSILTALLGDAIYADFNTARDNHPNSKLGIAEVLRLPAATQHANHEIAQANVDVGIPAPTTPATSATTSPQAPVKTILINFNNVGIIEFIRFISKVTNKNFIFDENELDFTVTIVSEEPTSIDNVMVALLQVLQIHNLMLTEQGNNIIIHKNPGVSAISEIVSDNLPPPDPKAEIVTRLFRLNTADPDKVAAVVRPLVSARAIVEVFKDSNYLIVTDLTANVDQIAKMLSSIDAPGGGMAIGQYLVKTGILDNLIQLTQKIIQPISQGAPLTLVPHRAVNSIFIITTPFLLERTLAILQYLDQNQGLTRIFDINDLRFNPNLGAPAGAEGQAGQWQPDAQGNWVFRLAPQPGIPKTNQPPQGYWTVDDQGNWRFQVGGTPPTGPSGIAGVSTPEGQWRLDSQGIWVFQLSSGKSISPERLVRAQQALAELPAGHIERVQFYIHKLRYRRGDQIQNALGRIGQSLSTSNANADLVNTINSVQWLESSNSLVGVGTAQTLAKLRELIDDIDTPLRQVLLEMLILETTIDDSLNFAVNWGTRFGGGPSSGSQAFLSAGSPLEIALDTTAIGSTPDASSLALTPGFNQGVIGRTLSHCGLRFSSIGSLVSALHDNNQVDIILNPKILTEDNYPAEIFVGINTRFPTQAITNDRGSIITQNFEFRDVGTRLKVTPLIGNNDFITLTIYEEVSDVIASDITVGEAGPTTRRNNTTTKVHLPDGFFLILSGMMQDELTRHRTQVPCLGGIPFIGAAFSDKVRLDRRRNLMIFIRPKIIDTEEEINDITKREQDIFRNKNYFRKFWEYETSEAMDFFNLPSCDTPCEKCDCKL